MINFPKEAEYTNIQGSKTIKECEKLLELTLRKLGFFPQNIPIEIKEYHSGESYSDIIYTVEDLNNTLFEFYNFGLNDTDRRYNKNYEVTMRRKNSNFTYKYDFDRDYYSSFEQRLRMIEISYDLTENRVMRLERRLHEPIRLLIEEDSKKYKIGFFNNTEENDTLLLEKFEDMVEKALQISELNLENILKIIKNQKQISFAFVFKNNKIIASVDFINGEINKYKIDEPYRKVEVTLYPKINRTTERIGINKIIRNSQEIMPEDYDLITLDYKRLFKEL